MQLPQLRSPLARAVVPVLAGIGFFVVLGLIMWGVAAWLSGSGEQIRVGDPTFQVGRVDLVADSIDEDGPHLYPDLKDPSGERSIVLSHDGTTDMRGWSVFRPVPADRPDSTCLASQKPGTREFVDCDGRTLDVEELAPAPDVTVVIEDGRLLVLEFAAALGD
jgi:hypothetical protein